MGNVYYAPGDQRAAKVNDLFGQIARRYDLINDVQSFGMHRRWKRRLIGLADPKPGLRALDVCCGTGDIAFALAAKGAEVVGLDFTEPMLAVAEDRRRKSEVRGQKAEDRSPTSELRPLTSVRFVHGDAMKLPFPDVSFDIITVGYGLRNLANWEVGLREMVRVAKPGGRVLVLDFGKPDNALWRGLFFGYLRLFVPVCGLILVGQADAYAYILESLKHYPAQRGLEAKMREMKLGKVRVVNLMGGAMSFNVGEKSS